ncbi:MAG: sulfur carrier protein ThiS [Planctomycetota bacterium]
MTITVNGEEKEIPGSTTVAGLISIMEIEAGRIAVEVNREIVTKSLHATHVLTDGDRVEIVTMVGGG